MSDWIIPWTDKPRFRFGSDAKEGSRRKHLEARVGFEPTDGGFADLSLRPLGYRAEVKEYSETAACLSVLNRDKQIILPRMIVSAWKVSGKLLS